MRRLRPYPRRQAGLSASQLSQQDTAGQACLHWRRGPELSGRWHFDAFFDQDQLSWTPGRLVVPA